MGTPRWARRFFEEVVMRHTGKRECLRWPYATNHKGYAQIGDWANSKRRSVLVGALICERLYGPAQPGHEHRHSCGKGHLACATPAHVSWSTHKTNMSDMKKHGTQPDTCGESNGRHKITERQANTIFKAKGLQREIAARYGIDRSQVGRIKQRKSWPHIHKGGRQ